MYLYANLKVFRTPKLVSTTTFFNPTVAEGGRVHRIIVLFALTIGLEHDDVPINTFTVVPLKFTPYIDIVDPPTNPPRRGNTEYIINCVVNGSSGL